MEPTTAGDLMIPLENYPHIPYWFTLREATALMFHSKIESAGTESLARALLVFDEEYRLLGMVRRRDIMKGLEPESIFKSQTFQTTHMFDIQPDPDLLELTFDTLLENCQKKANLRVSEIMIPIEQSVNYDDHIMKMIYEMNEYHRSLLPVLKDNVVVGVVRTVEVMNEIAKMLGII